MNKKLNIFFVSSTAYGGSFESLKLTTKVLKKYATHITALFILRENVDVAFPELDNVDVIIEKLPNFKKVFMFPLLGPSIKRAVEKAISNNHYDVAISYALVFTHYVLPPLKKRRIPVIFNINSFTHFRAKPVAKFYFRSACKNSDLVTFGSASLIKDFTAYYGFDCPNSAVLPMPIDTDRFAPVPDIPRSDILAVGRLVPLKRYDLLLRAFKIVHDEIPGVKLHIAGEGPDEGHLRRIARKLGIADYVVFHGFVDPLPLYQRAAVFVHTSEYETFCRVVGEALACETPAVSCTPGGPQDILADGVGGFWVSPNPEDIAEKTIFLLRNPDLARKMGRQGREKVIKNYSVPVYEKNLISLINQLLRERKNGTR